MRDVINAMLLAIMPVVPIVLAFVSAYFVEQKNWPIAAGSALICICLAMTNLGATITMAMGQIESDRTARR